MSDIEPNSGRASQPGGYGYTGQAPVIEDETAFSDAAVADELTEEQEQEQGDGEGNGAGGDAA